MKLLAIAAAALALLASPALAQNTLTEWSGRGYDVFGSSPGETPACIMQATYEIEGRADVNLNLVWDGEEATLALTSLDWTARDGEAYNDFFFYFPQSDTIYNGGETSGFVDSRVNKGFVTGFEPDFLDRMAAEDRFLVMRLNGAEGEDGVIVADMGLAGSGEAISALRRCAAYVVGRETARIRREGRNDYITRDPFKS